MPLTTSKNKSLSDILSDKVVLFSCKMGDRNDNIKYEQME